MSTIDYKALAERVAQRAIYAENNADPNNKAWAADLRAVVSLLNGMAEAQPVAWRCEVRDLLTQAEQCLSTAVQLEQFAYDEPPSYVSAWDYEADHIAAGIRAVLAAAPAVPQADAQPVAAVPVDWMERLKEAVKHIGYANVEKWYRLGGEDMIEQAKSDAVTAYATLCEALESLYAAPAAPQAEPKREPLHELPPLPEPAAYAYEWRLQTGSVHYSFSARHYNGVPCDDQVLFFTADQMHDYARAVERAAYERAAQECKRRWKGGYPQEVVDDCAAAIRALGRQHD